MCIDLENNRAIKFLKKYKFDIIIIVLFIILIVFLVKLHFNFVNYDKDHEILFENTNTIYTALIIGLITLIGIVFNLKDNDDLRKQQQSINKNKLQEITKRNNNIRLLIKTEIFNNLDIIKEFSSNMHFGEYVVISKPRCTINAWNSCYSELPSVFNPKELKILVEFYFELETFLDDKNWLNLPEGEPQDALGELIEISKPITHYNLETLQNNKLHILNMITKILKYEDDLSFLEEK